MAIMGFLVHVLPDAGADVESELKKMPEITTYGVHQECCVVAVAEAPKEELEQLMERVQALEGVLTSHVTSFTLEDELPEES